MCRHGYVPPTLAGCNLRSANLPGNPKLCRVMLSDTLPSVYSSDCRARTPRDGRLYFKKNPRYASRILFMDPFIAATGHLCFEGFYLQWSFDERSTLGHSVSTSTISGQGSRKSPWMPRRSPLLNDIGRVLQ